MGSGGESTGTGSGGEGTGSGGEDAGSGGEGSGGDAEATGGGEGGARTFVSWSGPGLGLELGSDVSEH